MQNTSLKHNNTKKINNLMESLSFYSKQRKKIRRTLCNYLRANKTVVKDHFLLRKIGGGWLGDLSDDKLISYCKEVKRYLGE